MGGFMNKEELKEEMINLYLKGTPVKAHRQKEEAEDKKIFYLVCALFVRYL